MAEITITAIAPHYAAIEDVVHSAPVNYVDETSWRRKGKLAWLIRKGKGLSERRNPELARFGTWAREELRRLCRMVKEPPTVGEWNMFYARFIRLVSMYGEREDEAGKFARRLRAEMDHLWLFLQEHGVAPTNNHADRMLRFAVLWRKRTYPVLVNAVASYFAGKQPDLAWIHADNGATP